MLQLPLPTWRGAHILLRGRGGARTGETRRPQVGPSQQIKGPRHPSLISSILLPQETSPAAQPAYTAPHKPAVPAECIPSSSASPFSLTYFPFTPRSNLSVMPYLRTPCTQGPRLQLCPTATGTAQVSHLHLPFCLESHADFSWVSTSCYNEAVIMGISHIVLGPYHVPESA